MGNYKIGFRVQSFYVVPSVIIPVNMYMHRGRGRVGRSSHLIYGMLATVTLGNLL